MTVSQTLQDSSSRLIQALSLNSRYQRSRENVLLYARARRFLRGYRLLTSLRLDAIDISRREFFF